MSGLHQSPRPVNLNLLRFHFPLPAVTSITHRLTGVVLFFSVWVLLYVLHDALTGFDTTRTLSEAPLGKLILLGIFAAASFHLLAGLKHLLLDLGIGEGLRAARIMSAGVWLLAIVSTVLLAAAMLI